MWPSDRACKTPSLSDNLWTEGRDRQRCWADHITGYLALLCTIPRMSGLATGPHQMMAVRVTLPPLVVTGQAGICAVERSPALPRSQPGHGQSHSAGEPLL